MKDKNMMNRSILTVSLFIIIASLMVFPWTNRKQGSFFVLTATLVLNVILSVSIIAVNIKGKAKNGKT